MATRRQFLTGTVATGIAALSRSVEGASETPGRHGHSGGVGTVQTVLGSLDSSELGSTLTHEHIADAPDVLPQHDHVHRGLIADVSRRLNDEQNA